MIHDELSKEDVHLNSDDLATDDQNLKLKEGTLSRKQLKNKLLLLLVFIIIGCVLIGIYSDERKAIFAKFEQIQAQIKEQRARDRELAKFYEFQLRYLSAKGIQTEAALKWKIEQLESQANNSKSGAPAALELDFLKKDANNKGISEVLYKDEATRKMRQAFYDERVRFVDLNSNVTSLFLTKYNLILDKETMEQGTKVNQEEWVRLEKKFKLSEFTEELPMCIIVPGYNNNDQFRIESNMNSIFTQNYTNYKVVIINDASNDGSGEVYRKYLDFYNIDRSRYVYVENQKKLTALLNIYQAVMHHCSMDSIAVTVDADDEMVGRNALQVFNWGYQKLKSGVLYSNYIWYNSIKTHGGHTTSYTEQEKKNHYRESDMRFSQLRSFRTEILHHLNPQNFKDSQGHYYMSTYDMVLFFPLMEMSCGRVDKIQGEYHYLYNTGTGINDFNVDHQLQIRTDQIIRKAKKLECYEQFNEKMSRS